LIGQLGVEAVGGAGGGGVVEVELAVSTIFTGFKEEEFY